MSLILGIETSCDECSASVVEHLPTEGYCRVLSLSTFSQVKLHEKFGGIVPEVASRSHLETINPIINHALKSAGIQTSRLDAIAVTNRPGLVGALLVGVASAKALAYVWKKPLVPVHHLEGHAASVFLSTERRAPVASSLSYPAIFAIISGGHTNLYHVAKPPLQWPREFLQDALIGRSIDDAAGEAFDKTAKLMGFTYPGGIHIDRTAKGGKPARFSFPRALRQKSSLDFSFSGLKTSVALQVQELKRANGLEAALPDLCASIQEAIVESIVSKIRLAIKQHGAESLVVAGGVAANSRLRECLADLKTPVVLADMKYCTDNAAMIAAAGAFRFQQGQYLAFEEALRMNAYASAAF